MELFDGVLLYFDTTTLYFTSTDSTMFLESPTTYIVILLSVSTNCTPVDLLGTLLNALLSLTIFNSS
ncbi:hypothetical protein D3C81_1565610 [compost metagenome]